MLGVDLTIAILASSYLTMGSQSPAPTVILEEATIDQGEAEANLLRIYAILLLSGDHHFTDRISDNLRDFV